MIGIFTMKTDLRWRDIIGPGSMLKDGISMALIEWTETGKSLQGFISLSKCSNFIKKLLENGLL